LGTPTQDKGRFFVCGMCGSSLGRLPLCYGGKGHVGEDRTPIDIASEVQTKTSSDAAFKSEFVACAGVLYNQGALVAFESLWNEAILVEVDRRMATFAADQGASEAWGRWMWGAVVVMIMHSLRFLELIQFAESYLQKQATLWKLAQGEDDNATAACFVACLKELRPKLQAHWDKVIQPQHGLKSPLFAVENRVVSAQARCQVGMYKCGVVMWDLANVDWVRTGTRYFRMVKEARILVNTNAPVEKFGT
jgi:hypothetical protein